MTLGRELNSEVLITVSPTSHPTMEKLLQEFIDESNEYKQEVSAVDGEATSLREQ